MNNQYHFVLAMVFILFAIPVSAYAYIDPGTGSYLVQILIAGLVGSALTIKIFFARIKSIFTRKGSNSSQADSKDE